jgi:hypothetical protein
MSCTALIAARTIAVKEPHLTIEDSNAALKSLVDLAP